MSYLAYKRMPVHLRVFTWLLLIDGPVRLIRWTVGRFSEDPPSMQLLGSGMLITYCAIQLRRGNREGTHWLLFHNGLLLAMMIYFWITGQPFDGLAWTFLAILAVVTAYVAWCHWRLPWRERGGYDHWMADGDYQDHVAQWFARRDEILEQDRRDPPDPDSVVRDLIDDDTEMARQRIIAQPGHFGMAIFRALDEPAFRRNTDALKVLIDSLPQSLHARAITRLTACLDHLEGYERESLLCKLAATGRPELEPLLHRELAGEDADGVAKGIAEAIAEQRIDEQLFDALEPALRSCLDREDCEHAAVALARHDPTFVDALLERASSLDENALDALVALGDQEVPLPPGPGAEVWRRTRDQQEWFYCWRLLPFVPVTEEELRELLPLTLPHIGTDEERRNSQAGKDNAFAYSRHTYVRAIEMLADRRVDDAEQLLRDAIDLKQSDISDEAASKLEDFLCVEHDWDSLKDEELDTPRRMLHSLHLADSLACNGGLVHAITYLDAPNMTVLEAALAAIAPSKVRDVWQRALRTVSDEALPIDGEERGELIRSRYDEVEGRLNALDTTYYEHNWELRVAMHLYSIEHRNDLATPLRNNEDA